MLDVWKMIFIGTLLFPISSVAETPTLSSDDANEVIQRRWDEICWKFPVGTVKILDRRGNGDWFNDDYSERYFTRKQVSWLNSAHKAGLIEITGVNDYTTSEREFSWDNFFRMTQGGEIGQISISPSREALSLYQDYLDYIKKNIVCFDIGTHNVGKIVDIDIISKNGDDYAIVRGFDTLKYNTKTMNYLKGRIESVPSWYMASDRKFRVLLKYDVFEEMWKYITGDAASVSEEFSTNDVKEELGIQ